jgi:hypothetical protein
MALAVVGGGPETAGVIGRMLLLPAGLLLAGLMAGCGTAPPTVPFELGAQDMVNFFDKYRQEAHV